MSFPLVAVPHPPSSLAPSVVTVSGVICFQVSSFWSVIVIHRVSLWLSSSWFIQFSEHLWKPKNPRPIDEIYKPNVHQNHHVGGYYACDGSEPSRAYFPDSLLLVSTQGVFRRPSRYLNRIPPSQQRTYSFIICNYNMHTKHTMLAPPWHHSRCSAYWNIKLSRCSLSFLHSNYRVYKSFVFTPCLITGSFILSWSLYSTFTFPQSGQHINLMIGNE